MNPIPVPENNPTSSGRLLWKVLHLQCRPTYMKMQFAKLSGQKVPEEETLLRHLQLPLPQTLLVHGLVELPPFVGMRISPRKENISLPLYLENFPTCLTPTYVLLRKLPLFSEASTVRRRRTDNSGLLSFTYCVYSG